MRRLLVFFIALTLFGKAQSQIVASPDTTICVGGTATLLIYSSPAYGTSSYTFETFPYSPEVYGGTKVPKSGLSVSTLIHGTDSR